MLAYIVEDDSDIRYVEIFALKNSGFKADGFDNAEDFYVSLEKKLPDIILLDIMMPGQDGFQVLKYIKMTERYKSIPVIMVSAKDLEIDKVKALDLGADDYLSKPFGVMELISRVKAVLRRSKPQSSFEDAYLNYDNVKIDIKSHSVYTDNKKVVLTHKEYELLKYLLLNKNIVISRQSLMNNVWGFDFEGETRTIDAHIKSLRQKLGDSGKIIKTIRNVGYKVGE
ncbi:response regulator transcription factor [Criibacterium bergeronii]|uniref:Stage 0 sporulation protein A homolog n=1 Tax=Criibacterium bergeronii TaxID=1871336 RepID=A0A371IJW8_9FIRM|nr:response regulator transcription factor [Criibacterium bergeronii]MBS6063313.1 response regulator transcription factor [Peptostreptococcaceae bacterium]RDY20788.1 DNA-binding response regulator [Criibacterium bergeronii]TRW26082.1 response regulator transcription factor [Criibacterium bergeronii]